MRIEFIRMLQFTLLVKAGDRLREFNFRKLRPAEEMAQFSVNVCDERGVRYFFTMQKAENSWELHATDRLPLWVEQHWAAISHALDRELENHLA